MADALTENVDCLIVGAGPAGLTAAVYLGRYRRPFLLADAGGSRASLIPCTHNYPGFPDGISGLDLLSRLRAQAERYGAVVTHGTVTDLTRQGERFSAKVGDTTIFARKVLLATGLVDCKPALPNLREIIYRGNVRLCPICDAYEATDKHVAVLGPVKEAIKKLLFLSGYTRKLTLLPIGDLSIDAQQERILRALRIPLPLQPVVDLRVDGDEITAVTADGTEERVEVLYPALGCIVRSDLLVGLGGEVDQNGYIVTDPHQQTTVPGVYAAGDVVNELNQLAVGTAHAAIAATAIHNTLNAEDRPAELRL